MKKSVVVVQVIPYMLLVLFFLPTIRADANPMGLNASDERFCATVRDEKFKEALSKSKRIKWKGKAKVSILKLGGSGSVEHENDSRYSREETRSKYESKNCDLLLQQAGQVTIAEIEADRDKAIERMKLEASKYGEDTRRILGSFELKAHKVSNHTERILGSAGVVKDIVLGIAEINAKRKLIDAETKVALASTTSAKPNQDRNLNMIRDWGHQTTSCGNSSVSILLIDDKEYCVEPSQELPRGKYKYVPSQNELVSVEAPKVKNTNSLATEPSLQEVSNPVKNTNSIIYPAVEPGL